MKEEEAYIAKLNQAIVGGATKKKPSTIDLRSLHYLYSYNYEGVTGCVVKYSSRQNVLIINLVREFIFGIKRKGNKTGLYLNLVIIALFW